MGILISEVGGSDTRAVKVQPSWVDHPALSTGRGDVLSTCPVDGALTWPNERAAGSFYLFTQVSEDGPPRSGRKTPEEIGRGGLYLAVHTSYAAAFPQDHPCHSGPLFGKVAQEGHPNSSELTLLRLHNHCACAFAEEHQWRAVERHLREVQGVRVGGPNP